MVREPWVISTSTTLVEKILVRITIFIVSGREPKDIIISKGVTSLTVGGETIGNYNLKEKHHLTLMPERETSEEGITTSRAVGEGTIRELLLSLYQKNLFGVDLTGLEKSLKYV